MRKWWLVVAGGVLGMPGLSAQEIALGEPVATHPEAFAFVSTIRELSDGRVLLADPLGTVLVALSPDLGSATVLAREGEGPQEYRQPDAVWPLPGDSTLLVDLGNGRLTVVAPDGGFVRTRPIQMGAFTPGHGPPPIMLPGGVDALGRIYFTGERQRLDGSPADSVALLRFDPASEAIDTLGRVKVSSLSVQNSGDTGNQQVRMSPVPLSGADAWAVAPDGRIAVAREGDYHIDWIGEGSGRQGPSLEVEQVSIGRAEREEWADDQQRNGGIGMAVTAINGDISVSMSRASGQRPSDLAALPWPDAKPPFVPGSARIDGGGRVWVRRSLPAGEFAPLYDVFDESGAHVASVRFPAGRRLVGFGPSGLYAVSVDAFDLLTLERYAPPPL